MIQAARDPATEGATARREEFTALLGGKPAPTAPRSLVEGAHWKRSTEMDGDLKHRNTVVLDDTMLLQVAHSVCSALADAPQSAN